MDGPDLVILFADADAERFVTRLMDRAVESGCLRSFERKVVRDPMHDAHVASQPEASLAPYLRHPSCRFLVILDLHGSGCDSRGAVERGIVEALQRAGVDRSRVAAIVFEPELEEALTPVWDRVHTILARKRSVPTQTQNLAMDSADPKASFAAALRGYRLKSSSALFHEMAGELSIPMLKEGSGLGRLAEHLSRWFGANVALES